MKATLTIEVESDILDLASQEALLHRTTLSEVLALYIKVLADNRRDSQNSKTPITDSLCGVITLPADADYREIVTEELVKKYGS